MNPWIQLAGGRADPKFATFQNFCDALGLQMSPAQREVVRVAYDGEAPSDSELGRALWDNPAAIVARHWPVFVAVCGARSGKSYILGALRLLHLALTVSLDTLATGEIAVCPIVAPDLATARQTLGFVIGAAEQIVPGMIVASSTESLTLRRGKHTVSIQTRAASAGGRSVRGRSMPAALLEELAFFRDSTYRVNDSEMWKAVQPRIMPGGQLLGISTPWTRSGLLYEKYLGNYGHPDECLVCHAPTSLMRDGDPILEQVERERRSDPSNARREFDAEFMSGDGTTFFDQRAVESAVDTSIVGIPEGSRVIEWGADFGFRYDSSALVCCARGLKDYTLAEVLELVPGESPLVPSAVVREFAARIVKSGRNVVTADAHYGESIREHMQAAGVQLMAAPDGATGKAETYALARTLLHGGELRLLRNERLARQLVEVTATPTSGGGISIQSPRWKTGGHGDIVSAAVLAIWRAHRGDFMSISAEQWRKLGSGLARVYG